jgi:hypothetical protein
MRALLLLCKQSPSHCVLPYALHVPSYKGIDPMMRALPCSYNSLSSVLIANAITWGIRDSTYKFWGNTYIYSITHDTLFNRGFKPM